MQFLVDKADRIAFLTPLIEKCGQCIADYTCAYDIPQMRAYYAPRVLGNFAVVRNDLRHMFAHNMVHKRNVCLSSSLPMYSPDTAMLEVAELLARIDKGIGNYVAYAVAQGKVAADMVTQQLNF